MNTMETTALVERAINKDNEAIEILFKTYYKDVLYVCSKLGLNEEDAKDIAQDSFITAFSTLSDIKDKSKFKQWVCGIANNKALNLLRHNKVLQIDSIDSEEYSLEIPGKEKATEDIVIDNEVADILKGLIDKLPLEQRIAVFMFYYEDMSVKEIATAYGCPESTIRSRLNYAKKTMETEINKMEDKGIKLRCIGALPFLFMLFAKEAKAFACEVPVSTAIIAEVMKNNIGAAGAAGGATVAAKTGIAGRIVAIACAVAVTAGVIFGIIKATGSKKANAPGNEVTVNSETDRVLEGEKETETKPASEETEKEEKEQKWYFEETSLPKLPKLVGHEVTCKDGVQTVISDTPYNYTPKEVINEIKELPFYKQFNCQTWTQRREKSDMDAVLAGGGVKYIYTDIICVAYDDDIYNDAFTIELNRHIYYSNDYDSITVKFPELEYGKENQEWAKDVLAVLFGEELARYLVYTEELQNVAADDNTTHYFEREIKRNNVRENEEPTMNVKFTVEIGNNDRDNYKGSSTYDGDYKSIIDELSFNLTDIIKGDIGSTDIFDLENFASKYMSYVVEEEYMHTMTSLNNTLYVSISEYPDGRTREYISISVMEYFGGSKVISPELFIEAGISKMKGEITDYNIGINGSSGIGFTMEGVQNDYRKLYPSLINKLQSLLSENVNLSELTYENTLKEDGTSEGYDEIECTGNYFESEADIQLAYEFRNFEDFGGEYHINFEIDITKKK